ncbi:mechanosensitive ion channel [Dasania sp. GY-MA-18]|uniref:Mechanosensitive ion channel n=1 Tax=Dasania phycosphaerae TaxID=2950436 RepID=A0A9J6RG68_9GAMM|nr:MULTISPECIES: mechanosensitive ion channel [Dasania]MCR8921218.1 mechanosensitive ion channel [Dasania sp. GY-MA-18]MCZ0863646.1 mechanosensitive ion channel [Dasania phycosphaerae]MCZ0867374.1 mechanosensitive ion channel [Dasania phycosphaerae]
MAESKPVFDWQNTLTETYHEFARQTIEHIPQLLGALALLLIGWVMAWLLRLVARKLIRGLDVLLLRTAQKRGLAQSSNRSYAHWVGNIVFWSVLLFFIAASANMMDWKIIASASNALLIYLPNVLTGLLIILAGFALSGIARSAVASAAESTGIAQAELLARIAQVSVVLTAVIIGAEQLGINVTFLTTALIVITGIFFGGAALAFGLGAKHFVANVIGVQTACKHYQLGQLIKIDDIEGYLLEITSTLVILDTPQGRAAIPAKLFHEKISEIITDTASNEAEPPLTGNRFSKKGGHDEPV